MAMVCPQCAQPFQQRLQCPTCGVRLQYEASDPDKGSGFRRALSDQWQQKPWGRLLVGLMLAQGLFYGMWHLCLAGLLAAGTEEGQSVWDRLTVVLVSQGLQAVA